MSDSEDTSARPSSTTFGLAGLVANNPLTENSSMLDFISFLFIFLCKSFLTLKANYTKQNPIRKE